MPTRINRPPLFVEVRSKAGAFAADSTTLSDANYPLTSAFEPMGGGAAVAVYWYATGGTVHALDFVDLQILYRDSKYSTAGQWTEGPIQSGIKQNAIVTFPTANCSMCYIRVLGVNSAAGTGLRVLAATAAYTE